MESIFVAIVAFGGTLLCINLIVGWWRITSNEKYRAVKNDGDNWTAEYITFWGWATIIDAESDRPLIFSSKKKALNAAEKFIVNRAEGNETYYSEDEL